MNQHALRPLSRLVFGTAVALSALAFALPAVAQSVPGGAAHEATPATAASAASEATGTPAPAAPVAATAPAAPVAEASPAAAATPTPAAAAPAAATALAADCPPALVPTTPTGYRWGAHFELDVGVLLALRQSAAFAGGVVYGPFRAGVSYATFLSNSSFGGVPDGFSLRANYILGFNAAYFIGQSTDEGLYVQGMFQIKQQGVTNIDTGDHKDLNSLLTGLEVGYVWKVYQGLYIAPRVGALYYVKSPQGPNNDPIQIGDRAYDNDRHKVFDTYFIPTLSVGYSW